MCRLHNETNDVTLRPRLDSENQERNSQSEVDAANTALVIAALAIAALGHMVTKN